MTEHTDAEGDPVFVAVVCNGCSSILVAPTADELVTEADAMGWSIGENLGDDDFCRRCREEIMADTTKRELQIEGYTAQIRATETVVRATGRSYDPWDDRAHEVALRIPTDDLLRVAGLLNDAHDSASEMPK